MGDGTTNNRTPAPQAPSFSGANKAPTYSSYLKVDELLSLQEPLSSPPAHDEMLFIIVHQTYELWFKQVMHEMNALITHMLRNDLISSMRFLGRVSEIFKVLVQQIDVLETMTPVEFNRFRSHLNPASGFQSFQFRELELLAGAAPEEYSRFMELNPEWKERVQKKMKGVNLRTALCQLLAQHGLLPTREASELTEAVVTIYHEPSHSALASLCEGLIQFDEQFLLWRFRHVQMVERMIGMKPGTGGSLGVSYLQQTLRKKFFPELWQARTEMGTGAY